MNIIGFKQFEDTLKKLPSTLRKEVGTRVRASADQFRDLAIKDAPADVGFLRSQITVEKIDDLKYEVVSGSSYSAPMEFGTKSKFTAIPGIDASEFKGLPTGGTWREFLESMKKWVKKKGLATITNSYTGKKRTKKKDIDMLAYVIARKIYKDGVTPHPFFFKQIPIVRRDLFRNIRNILNGL